VCSGCREKTVIFAPGTLARTSAIVAVRIASSPALRPPYDPQIPTTGDAAELSETAVRPSGYPPASRRNASLRGPDLQQPAQRAEALGPAVVDGHGSASFLVGLGSAMAAAVAEADGVVGLLKGLLTGVGSLLRRLV
jgi:hypothetical protein